MGLNFHPTKFVMPSLLDVIKRLLNQSNRYSRYLLCSTSWRTMPGKYKLSFIEQCLLALACIFQVLLIFYSLRVNSFVWRKFTAFTLQKILNRIVATMTVLTYVRYYASMKNVIEELRQLGEWQLPNAYIILLPNPLKKSFVFFFMEVIMYDSTIKVSYLNLKKECTIRILWGVWCNTQDTRSDPRSTKAV